MMRIFIFDSKNANMNKIFIKAKTCVLKCCFLKHQYCIAILLASFNNFRHFMKEKNLLQLLYWINSFEQTR